MAKEETVDLKRKAEKISQEHLTEMQGIVNKINMVQFNVGKLEAQKHTFLHDLAVTQDKISIFQDVLTKEYGTYDINLNDGTINWPEESNSNSVEKPKEDEK